MSRTFVIGDIHGAYRALRQCLERASFDYENDHLISLGDVCDGWPDTKQCIDELLKIKHLIYVLGNHDVWALEWMTLRFADTHWLGQGGAATVRSYQDDIPSQHILFLQEALPYYLFENRLFVHAGIDPFVPLERQDLTIFLWDRNLANTVLSDYAMARENKIMDYDEVYIGHTPIPYHHPIYSSGVWMMDTGAGWSGVLSMMNIDTKEIITSDPVPTLYPGVTGRKKHGT